MGLGTTARVGITRIPMVVHVVWNTNAQNISDAQIQSQIAVLNRDYRMTNADIGNVPSVWQSIRGDARIEFFLATTDPNGNPSTGVTRTQTTHTSFPQSGNPIKFAAQGGADAWPADTYLNIWVAPRITSSIGDLLGYAQFPGGPANTDGVVILHSAFGTSGTAAAPYNLGRTATHEIGHWLNLIHIWGDVTDCSGTDNVADTPNAGGPNYSCPTFPHVTCNNGPNGDMFMNYMDYTDDACMFMFTQGQVARMQSALDGSRTSIGVRITPTITWNPPAPIVYGTALPASALGATASVPGTFTYNPPAGTCPLPAGIHTLSVTFTPNDTVNYNTATATVPLTVLKATPVVNWNPPADIVYGTPLGNAQCNASATWVVCSASVTVAGTFAYSPPVGTCPLPAGLHQLHVLFTPNDTANYNSATAAVPLTVVKATPVIAWPTPADIDQTDPLPSAAFPTANPTCVVCNSTITVPGTYVYSPAPGSLLPVGTQTLTASFTPADTTNFNPATATAQIQVHTGYPIVVNATFSPVVIPLNISHPVLNVLVTVMNDSIRPHVSQGPNPGFEYSEGDTFETKGFPPVNGAFRIGVDLEETTYKVDYLYRWGFGKNLVPLEPVQVSGMIRFHNIQHNGHYYVGMIQEPNKVVQDRQCTTMVTVVPSFLP